MSASSQPQKQSTGEFIALMAFLMSLVALAIDAILPAFYKVGASFEIADQNQLQLLVGCVFLGMAIGQLFYGPLSDSVGRKPATYLGLFLFFIGSLVSAYAPTYDVMLLGRFIQGFGVAGPRTLTVAFVRDQYSGRQMARIMSFTMSIFILVPALAPTLGTVILTFSTWESIFYSFALMAVMLSVWMSLRQPETLKKEYRKAFSLSTVLSGAKEAITNRRSAGYLFVSGFTFANLVIYLNTSKLLYLDIYGIDELFPLYFAILALAVGMAAIVNGKIVLKYGMRTLMRLSLIGMSCVSISFLLYLYLIDGHPDFIVFMTVMFIFFFMMGVVFGNSNAMAMEPMGHIAGVASSVIGAGTTFVSMTLGTVIGMQYDQTLVPMIAGFTILSIATLLLMTWIEKK